jgi:hypothetical protein
MGTMHIATIFTEPVFVARDGYAVEVAEQGPGAVGTEGLGVPLLTLPLSLGADATEAQILEAAEDALNAAGWNVTLDEEGDYIEVDGYDSRGWQVETLALFATVTRRAVS